MSESSLNAEGNFPSRMWSLLSLDRRPKSCLGESLHQRTKLLLLKHEECCIYLKIHLLYTGFLQIRPISKESQCVPRRVITSPGSVAVAIGIALGYGAKDRPSDRNFRETHRRRPR